MSKHFNIVAAAYLIDRAHRFTEESGQRWVLIEAAWSLVGGDHEDAHLHGELDDLIKDIREKLNHESRRKAGAK